MLTTANLTTQENISLSKEMSLIAATDTPLTTLLLANGQIEKATGKIHTWRERTLDATANITVAEGADADPDTFTKSTRVELSNVCQILLKTTAVSGTAQATAGTSVTDLFSQEINDRLIELKINLEKQLLTSTKDDGSVSGVRAMAGLTSWVDANNVITPAEALTEDHIKGLAKALWTQGTNGRMVCFLNADMKEAVDALFADKYSYVHSTNDFGLVVSTYNTNYGQLQFILNRHMPEDQIICVNLDALKIAFLREPQFELLGKVGDSIRGHVVTEATLRVASKKAVASFTLAEGGDEGGEQ